MKSTAIVITPEFNVRDIVYLITDPDQLARLVVSVVYDGSNALMYNLMCGTMSSTHYAAEISFEKQFVK